MNNLEIAGTAMHISQAEAAILGDLEIPVMDFDTCDGIPCDFDIDNLPPDLQALLARDICGASSNNSQTQSLSIPSEIQSFAARNSTPYSEVHCASVNSNQQSFEWKVDFNVLRRSNTLASGLPAAVQRSARKIEHEAVAVACVSRAVSPGLSWAQQSNGHSSNSSSMQRIALLARALSRSGTRGQCDIDSIPRHEPPLPPLSLAPATLGPTDEEIDRMLRGTINDDDVEQFLRPAQCPSSSASFNEVAYVLSPPRGLMNLGNTCFLNSAIQALGHCALLAAYLLQGLFVPDLNEANPLGTGCVLPLVFSALLHELFSLRPTSALEPLIDGASKDMEKAFPPLDFLLAVAQFNPFLATGEMHDAQELLAWLLDALHEDLNRVRRRPNETGVARLTADSSQLDERGEERYAAEAWMEHLRFNRSVIVDLFQGQLRSQLRCPLCGVRSVTFDPFLHLTLPLPCEQDAVISLHDAINLFCREEALDEDNLWTCPGCRQKVRAIKQLSLWKLPQILVLSLKRLEWIVEPPNFSVRKLNCFVNLPLERLDLSAYVTPEAPQKIPLIYDVVSVVDHIGNRADEGHYTASCHRPDGWFHFNDSIVSPLEFGSPIISRDNYILFLERRGSPCEPHAIAEQRPSCPQAWPHVVDADWSFLTGSDSFDSRR